LLTLVREEIERAHIVQSVRQLDDNHAHVLCHCHENFTEIFRIRILLGLEHDFFQLGYACNKFKHLFAKFPFDILLACRRILNDVVQERGGNRRPVQAQIHQNIGYRAGVDKVRFARGALLVRVRIPCKQKRLFQLCRFFLRIFRFNFF
jgi:hypothetical protein